MKKTMRKISKEELNKILENHKHWLNKDVEGWENMCADLRDMDLRGVDLSEANLRMAELNGVDLFEACLRNADFRGAHLNGAILGFTDLCGANLNGAYLRWANLCSSNLHGAKLFMANLSNADLYAANFYSADLSNAKLYRVNLRAADLSGANLCNAILFMADLCGANLRGADLTGANLCKAHLYGANLSRAKLYISRDSLIGADFREADLSEAILSNQEFINSKLPICCPEEGSFIGWKKAYVFSSDADCTERLFIGIGCNRTPVIVKLLIPNTAKRLSATSRKCRCNEAKVIDIQSVEFDGPSISETFKEAFSGRDPKFVYRIGETVRVEDFDDNRWNECSTGIHFFITRKEAVDYYI